jgi:DNA-binding FadR family transcriptional regulator
MEELVEARNLIEVELAGLAAPRATVAGIEEIGAHLDEMETSRLMSSGFQASRHRCSFGSRPSLTQSNSHECSASGSEPTSELDRQGVAIRFRYGNGA